MNPSLAFPGEMRPGEFGPTNAVPLARAAALISIVSATGNSSAVATTSRQPASIASIVAPSTAAGGTKTIAVSAPVSSRAARTLPNTGTSPPTVGPSLPGDTPAAILV